MDSLGFRAYPPTYRWKILCRPFTSTALKSSPLNQFLCFHGFILFAQAVFSDPARIDRCPFVKIAFRCGLPLSAFFFRALDPDMSITDEASYAILQDTRAGNLQQFFADITVAGATFPVHTTDKLLEVPYGVILETRRKMRHGPIGPCRIMHSVVSSYHRHYSHSSFLTSA